jgi:hypothetical protein
MENWNVVKYGNEWALFCTQSRCYVCFGTKKQMTSRLNQLK